MMMMMMMMMMMIIIIIIIVIIPLLYDITLRKIGEKIGEVAFVVVILSSYYHNTKWLKSFSVPSLGFQHILSHLPLLQGSLPKNKAI